LEKKIRTAIEGFGTSRFCELILRDRNRLSKDNALTVSDYIIAMKREVNPRLSYKRSIIQIIAELSKTIGIAKKFIDMTRDDLLSYLDKYRKPENEDPSHKWVGSYNTKLVVLSRFFKWLHYPHIDDPKRRNELSALERKPDCIMGIRQLKRKEISCYKPSDLWSQEDDLLFLKWVTNKRDRCYRTMARDLSARPHEILNLKIKDIVFKTTADRKQYAEVLVNGKTGARHIPLIQSIPYIKDWLSNHPSRNNPNSPLFVGLGRNCLGRQLGITGLYQIYKYYKEVFFPSPLKNLSRIEGSKFSNSLVIFVCKSFSLFTLSSTRLRYSTILSCSSLHGTGTITSLNQFIFVRASWYQWTFHPPHKRSRDFCSIGQLNFLLKSNVIQLTRVI
jgi:integrase